MQEPIDRPSILVIFGITGDLAQRKLLPALYHLFKDDLLDPRTVIVGITRREVSADELLNTVELCVNEVDKVCDPGALKKVQNALQMHQMSLTDPKEYQNLLHLLNDIEEKAGVCMNRLYYLSIPPQMFEPIVRNLGEQGLNTSCQHNQADTRLLVEKPFGYDLKSAYELIAETSAWFKEDQLFRIDHYLAKDTVQNILAFRKLNPVVERLWNNSHIESIEITAFEKIDIEGRVTFYEEVGALRDFIQSHLLQLLGVVTMEIPESITSHSVHEARLRLLQSIAPIEEMNVAATAMRGQYEGYREEVGNTASTTETFARVDLVINNTRWEGVLFRLQTGKAMAEKRTDIKIRFTSNATLTYTIQPVAGVSFITSENNTNDTYAKLRSIIQIFNKLYPPSPTAHPDAYEKVLIDAVRGDHTLFTTSEEVLAAWRIVTNIIEMWSRDSQDLKLYPKGSASLL